MHGSGNTRVQNGESTLRRVIPGVIRLRIDRMRPIAFIVCLSFASQSAADEFDPFSGPKPILVFIQSDPWKMVIGSDTPRVAVYENGDVIFTKTIDNKLVYHNASVDAKALDQLRDRIKPILAMEELQSKYNIAPHVTDQPEAKFFLRDGERELTSRVYGLQAPGTRLRAYTQFPKDVAPTPPPDQL